MNRSRNLHWLALPILGIQGGLVLWYVWVGWSQTGPGFPFDDGWIHAVFARNLAQYGAIGFHAGEWTGGTSSLLWVLVLALGQWIGLSAPVTAVLYGTAGWVVTGACFFALLRAYLKNHWVALAWTLLLAAVGPLTYLALSGMETGLFLALGLLALVAYQCNRHGLVGILLALLVLTRIEGLALVGLVSLALAIRYRRGALDPLVRTLLPPLVILLLYAGFNLIVTGHPLPTTMAGRKWLWGLPDQLIVLTPTLLFDYLRIWRIYVEEWLFHASVLPAPLGMVYRVLLWGSLLLGLFVLLRQTVTRVRRLDFPAPLLLFWWGIVHNVVYLLLSPFPSIRHQVPNLLLLILLLAAAWQAADGWLARRRTSLRLIPASVALVLAMGLVPSVRDWQRAYADHVGQINQVHVQAGRWIDAHLPPDAVVAAFDIGAVTYFGQRYTLDLGGLVDSEFTTDYLYPGRVPDYLREERATHLAMVETDAAVSGLGRKLGLADPAEAGLRLEPEVTFRAEPQVQAPFDSLPNYFYLPAYWQITVYRLDQDKP